MRALLAKRRRLAATDYLDFPLIEPAQHTMGESLHGYVAQRVPGARVAWAMQQGFEVEVHGIPAEVLIAHQAELQIPGALEELELAYNRWPRARCSLRPTFYLAREARKVIVAVISGRDYVRHYAGLLRHFLHFEAGRAERALTVVEYPQMERALCQWTGFDGVVVPGDLLFYGYAADFLEYLQECGVPELERAPGFENDYYYAERRRMGHVMLNFYECKHHGWGNISALTMKRAAELGAEEIFYISKGATCESPAEIYHKIYTPTRYVVARYTTLFGRTTSHLRNPLVGFAPELDTGGHLSLPSVMEEDYAMREVLTESGAVSLDNEAAQIAVGIEDVNTALGSDVGFTAIQFPTDYVRRPEEAGLAVDFDLENNRRAPAEALRKVIKRQIFGHVERYLRDRAGA